MDEALLAALSDRLIDQVNAERARHSLPPLRRGQQPAVSDALSWGDTCAKVRRLLTA